ncbi:N-acetyl-gamma-glutamyl-phosphate reductase [Rhypophila decipiens]
MSSSFHSRSESSRGHKHSSGKDSRHRKHHSSKPSGPIQGAGPRFLFVVNEVTFEQTYNERFPLDSWGNQVPPGTTAAYGREHVGRVFQYDNGHVAPAPPEYSWYRPGVGFPGSIVRSNPSGSFHMMIPYKTGTVFACSPHLPIIVAECDVSCDPTWVFKDCRCGNDGDSFRWNLLSFYGTRGFTGVNAVAGGTPYVLGANPSWIPSLVPRVFENPDGNVPRSTGLGGDLPTLIGLMAFHGRPGRTSDVFSSGRWQQNQWHGSPHPPTGYPNPLQEDPRGFVVHVAMYMPLEDFDEGAVDALRTEFEEFVRDIIFVRG